MLVARALSVLHRRALIAVFACAPLLGCGGADGTDDSGLSADSIDGKADGISNCHGHASSTISSGGSYFLTSFGFSGSDNGTMSCGQKTNGGSWYYAASRQRYGC